MKPTAAFLKLPRTYWLWILLLLAIPLLMWVKNRTGEQGELLSQGQFMQKFNTGQIVQGVIVYDPQSHYLHEIRGKCLRTDADGKTMMDQRGEPITVPFTCKVRMTGEMEDRLLSSGRFEARQPNNFLLSLFYSLLPIVIIGALIWFFFVRQIRMAAKASSLASTQYRHIVNLWGQPVVEGTRIAVHEVVAMAQKGYGLDDVLARFPSLTRAQYYECLAYYEDHKSELEPLLK